MTYRFLAFFLLFTSVVFGQDTIAFYDFESGAQGWSTYNNTDLYNNSTYACSGNQSMIINGSGNPAAAKGYIDSPTLNFSNYSTIQVSFCHTSLNLDNGDGFSVWYFNGSSWENIDIFVKGSTNWQSNGSTYTFTIGDGNSCLSENARISFGGYNAVNKEYNFFDDILVEGIGGGNGEIDITGSAISITNGDNIPSTLDGTDFGNVIIGDIESQTFNIENLNTGSVINLTGSPLVSISGDTEFAISSQPSSSSIYGCGNSESFVVSFNPTTEGVFTAIITISNSDSNEGTYTFTVKGVGKNLKGPGGVTSDLQLWLKADEGITTNASNGVINWATQARGADASVNTTGQEPTFRDDATYNINYNPVVDFDNEVTGIGSDPYFSSLNQQFLSGTDGFYSQDIFLVIIPDIQVSSSSYPMDLFCGDDPLHEPDSEDVTGVGFGNYTAALDGELLTYAQNVNAEYRIADNTLNKDYDNIGIINPRNNSLGSGMELYYNANDVGTVVINPSTFYNMNNTNYWIGRSEYWGASTNARIAEIITYSARKDDANLTQERNRIQSYLAIKYGITLGVNGTSQDYVDSDGTIIWDQSANTGYNYNIAGIGRDDASELNQKQSKTVNATDDITLGLTTIESTNNLNTNTFSTDRNFIMWGNNNEALSAQASVVDLSSGITGLETEVEFTNFGRIWKVVETGDVASAKIALPKTMLTNTITTANTFYLFISNTSTFDSSTEFKEMSEKGDNLEVDYDFPANGTKYITFGYAPEKTFVRSIQFDGTKDYLDAGPNLNLNTSEFTISAWINRNNTVDGSIISKRNQSFNSGGFDILITNSGNVSVTWKNDRTQSITSNTQLPKNQWHQIALVYDGTEAYIYIDGVLDYSKELTPPTNNTENFLIAAADGDESNTTSFFKGNIDEVRVWNVALTENQLRFIMNQEIEEELSNVNGTYFKTSLNTKPTKNEIESIPWSNLVAYYPMSTYTFTNCKDASGNDYTAAIKNLTTVDYQTAPLPYISETDGNWDAASTWKNGTIQTLPGATSIVDSNITIDWNIVQIQSNVLMDNATLPTANNYNRYMLGLIIDENFELELNGDNTNKTGNALTVTHYLGLNGTLDLEGESQLIQTVDSDLAHGAEAKLERDQQGKGNMYRYNDWSSPVKQIYSSGTYTIPTNDTYNIAGVLRDGTNPASPQPITFIGGYNGNVGPPLQIANYWLYVYTNFAHDDYSKWTRAGSEGILEAGEGFLMKGTGAAEEQNYVFEGVPNNGEISLEITSNNDYLVGNPYPSALDADQFIIDNQSSIEGTLYFYDHFGGNSHNLASYQAGFAAYNLSGGVKATNLPEHSNTDPTAKGTKEPKRYIPVGQAFFVQGKGASTGIKPIVFKNSQRVFVTENVDTDTLSVFMKSQAKNTAEHIFSDSRRKIRLGFNAPNGAHRQLLLTEDSRATEAIDYGFDGEIYDLNNSDIYWLIDNEKFVLQGTNQFNKETEMPLGIQLKEPGKFTISIDELENVNDNFNLYIKDNTTGETYNLKENKFTYELEAGEHNDRFLLVFQPRLKTLAEMSVSEGMFIRMNNTTSSIEIHKIVDAKIKQVQLYNYLGQLVFTWQNLPNDRTVYLPTNQIITGAYIVNMETNAGIISKKIIIE